MKIKEGPNAKFFSKRKLNFTKINGYVKKYKLTDKLFELNQTANLLIENDYLSRIGLDEEPYRWAIEKSGNYYEFVYYIIEMLRNGILAIDNK